MGKKNKNKNKGMKADSSMLNNMPKGPVPMPTQRGAVPMFTGNAGFGLAKGGMASKAKAVKKVAAKKSGRRGG